MGEFTEIKVKFDNVLVKHIVRLLEISAETASLSFNLATLACLLLAVERENEIKAFPASPPERYDKDTFIEDIEDLGLEIDDDIIGALNALKNHGYVSIAQNESYHAQIPAFALVSFIDNLFPGMPGMSFIAYIIQTIEEVVSGRKDIEEALSQFDQTLQKKGVPLSQQNLDSQGKALKHEAVRPQPVKKISKEELEALKRVQLEKLSRLKSRHGGDEQEPAIITKDGYTRRFQIKELFPRLDSVAAEDDTTPAEISRAVEPEIITAAPEPAQSYEPEPVEPQEIPVEADDADDDFLTESIEETPISPAPIRLLPVDEEPRPVENILSEFDIEKQISAFSESLAPPCPICRIGKITSATTEKGKTYFACSSDDCNFISWNKPHPHPCPVCSNPFLLEVNTVSGKPGLRCPRATCSYHQDGLGAPNIQATGSADSPVDSLEKKKRKVVRRVVRKKR